TNALGTTVQWYDAAKSKSGGDVGVNGAVVGNVSLGNGSIYGHLHTGPGSLSSMVQMGPHGEVGDVTWCASNDGIEGDGSASSCWAPDFNVSLPDVPAPAWVGSGLPAVVASGNPYAGSIVIPVDSNTTNYAVGADPGKPLVITGPCQLWIKGSISGLT